MKLEQGFAIKSDIISNKYNIFWKDISDLITDTTPKKILVLSLNYSPASFEEGQLKKMLQACTLTPEQYHIVKIGEGQLVAWHKINEQLHPQITLLVGVLPAQLGISATFRLNEPNFFNECLFIPTLSINELEQSPEVKKQLWNIGLKPVFIDKKIGNF